MLSDKINGLPISRVDSPALSRVDPPPIGRLESQPISRVDLPQVSRVQPPQVSRVAPPPINRMQSPSISSFDDQNGANLVNRQGNILSFDNARRNSGPVVDRDRSEILIPAPTAPLAKPGAY